MVLEWRSDKFYNALECALMTKKVQSPLLHVRRGWYELFIRGQFLTKCCSFNGIVILKVIVVFNLETVGFAIVLRIYVGNVRSVHKYRTGGVQWIWNKANTNTTDIYVAVLFAFQGVGWSGSGEWAGGKGRTRKLIAGNFGGRPITRVCTGSW